MNIRMLLWATFLPLLAVPHVAAAAGLKAPEVKTEIFADTASVGPGQVFTVAIRVTPPAEWHIYWKNPGDAGEATRFKFSLPEGFTAGAVAFPMPAVMGQPGDIIAYAYSGPTIFLTRITAPKDWPAGKAVTVGADVSWLCCRNVCVPGSAKISLTIDPHAGAAGSQAPARFFESARAAMPHAAPPADLVSAIKPLPASPDHKASGTLGMIIAWKKSPQAVAVFPLAIEGLEVSDIKAETSQGQTRVTLRARVLAGAKVKAPRLPLLITCGDGGGGRAGFYTEIDLGAIAPPQNKP